MPTQIGKFKQLMKIDLGANYLESLPEWFGYSFANLAFLRITNNEFEEFPSAICEIRSLTTLHIANNRITTVPNTLAKLDHLETLWINNNPLNPALQSAYDLRDWKRSQSIPAQSRRNAEPLYEAKLVLVGEGNVGKTTLLKALKVKREDRAPKKDETTTHGVEIDIHGLQLPHPEKEGVEIQLNAWDFGGQEVYRVTHQFFFSRRSLYLLVWEPRRGVQQGQVEDWLNMIRLRVGDDARVHHRLHILQNGRAHRAHRQARLQTAIW